MSRKRSVEPVWTPIFEMPTCWRHFFKGHRWWCRACDQEAERQFREVCEAYWPLARQQRERNR